jgi:pyruvate-formate lyase-activating enzyme
LNIKEIIPSTMGEPLLYPYFEHFIDKLKNTQTKLNLTTNGTFPKKGVAVWAEKILPITSDTKISINSISKQINEFIMINADTDMILKNIRTYLQVRDETRINNIEHHPTVTLQMTFMQKNLFSIKELIEFAIKNKVDRVKGHHLWITHPELIQQDLRRPEHINEWNRFIEEIKPYRTQINLENFELLSEKSEINPSYDCPFLGKELWIDCYGNYNVCCAPSEQRETLGNFGNIHTTAINQFFATEQYQWLLKNYKNQLLCKTCLLRKSN